MSETIVKTVHGYCYHLEENHYIHIIIEKYYPSRNDSPHYKKTAYKCNHYRGCTCLDKNGLCDLYKSAMYTL